MSMDIYAKPGTKVVFTGLNGRDSDQQSARKVLVIGKTYIVKHIEVGSWQSDVYLEGFDRSFNTVMFIEEEKYNKEK